MLIKFMHQADFAKKKPDIVEHFDLYRRVLEALPVPIWVKNIHGKYVACNRHFEVLFGYSAKQIIGRSDSDLGLDNIHQKYDREVILNNTSITTEIWVSSKKSEQRKLIETRRVPLHDEKKQVIGVLCIAHNINARWQSEAKLQESEERFALAMKGANDGLWDWNLETNEVYYSPRWKSMLGYEQNELADHLSTWVDLVHPEDYLEVYTKVLDYIEAREHCLDVEMRMRHKMGHYVFVLSRAFLVHRESDGQPVRLVGTHVDISERKKAEKHNEQNAQILEIVATGKPTSKIYDVIALMYEARHPGLRCSILELVDGYLIHGGAPSLPQEYCEAVNGLKYGPNTGSCGSSTYTGKRVVVENIETDPKWEEVKHIALPHGMRCCWSEPIKNSAGKVLGAFAMYYDYPAAPNEEESLDLHAAARLAGIVMERDQAQKRIRHLAFTDDLTSIPNRASFYRHLEKSIQYADQLSARLALLYIDLDDFKNINDTLGHDMGDALLQAIALRLKEVIRKQDFVARLGGDEFCIVLDGLDGIHTAATIAQRCLDILAQPITLASRRFTPTCSIGIAHYPEDGQDSSGLIKAADTSLYAAKARGKQQYTFYQRELSQRAEYNFRVEQSLREAVENNELSLMYQPQVEIASGKIIGIEALSRWHHPDLGDISPTEFIPLAEKIGVIKPLTRWVMTAACHQAVAWQTVGLPPVKISINISPLHLVDKEIVSWTEKVLQETNLSPDLLELEVTESTVHTEHKNLAVFQGLKNLGVRIAIDDFGSGYSSFASLNHLKVDCLKIDQCFIKKMLEDKTSKVLVSSMIEICHSLGYEVVAEGVETLAQCTLLEALGCAIAQGFYFSPPLPSAEMSKLLIDGFSFKHSSRLWFD